MWTDPGSGRRVTVWAFVMVLSCSRHMFVRPVLRMDQRAWTEAHVEAFRVLRRGARRGSCRTTWPPGWNAPTCTTRNSTARMPSWPSTTACWSTRPGPASPGTSRGWSGRCRTCATRSGGAGSSPRWRRCRPRRCAGAPRWPVPRACRPLDGAAPAAVFAAVEAGGAATVAGPAVRAGDVVDRQGRPGHPRQGRQGVVLGAVAADRAAAGRPRDLDHGPAVPQWTAGRHPRPGRQGQAHRHVALPAGEDRVRDADPDLVPAPRRRDRPGLHRRSSPRCWRSARCTGCARRRASSAWPTSTAPARLEAACAKATAAGDPSYRTIKGILAAGAGDRPAAGPDRRRRRRRAPARPGRAVRQRLPAARIADGDEAGGLMDGADASAGTRSAGPPTAPMPGSPSGWPSTSPPC